MFSWLTRMFGGEQKPTVAKHSMPQRSMPQRSTPQRSTPREAQPTVAAKPSAQRASSREPGTPGEVESYVDKLRKQLGELPALTPELERETTSLVEDVSYFVSTHRIDPPVMPILATRMLELLREDEVDVVALARLIEKDQATAAKLLSIANSPLFRGANEITGLRDAIVFLGTEQVAQIAIGVASRALFDGSSKAQDGEAARLQRLFQHGMTTAFAACQVASRRNRRHSEPAFLGGLFHDVGKSVALRAMSAMSAKNGAPLPSAQVIDEALQLIHGDPRAALYEHWKLPKPLMDMCQHHHRLHGEPAPELHVVRLVSALHLLHRGVPAEQRDTLQEIAESAAALEMSDPELRMVDSETREYAERVKVMFA